MIPDLPPVPEFKVGDIVRLEPAGGPFEVVGLGGGMVKLRPAWVLSKPL